MSKIEKKIYNNAKRLISPIGSFEWRGTDTISALAISDGKQWNFSEAGDQQYHTAVLLNSLAFRYHYHSTKTEKTDTLKTIKRLLSYFEFSQEVGKGMFCRYFALKKAYDQFPPAHKHGSKSFSWSDTSGGHMRYVECKGPDGKSYMARYDISPDPVLVSMTALYWVQKFVPELRGRVVNITEKVLQFYKNNNWKIKDRETGGLLRYGFHKPYPFNMFAATARVIGETIISVKKKEGLYYKICIWFPNQARTFIPGIYKSKRTRNSFNNYALLMGYSVLLDMGYNVKKGINRLVKENEWEYNYFSNAIHNWFNGMKKKSMPDQEFMIQKDHPVGSIPTQIVLQFDNRVHYNYWESNPYHASITRRKPVNGLPGNEAFLQAYWYDKHSILH